MPDFGGGAMENWGLVIYREIYLLYNPAVTSVYTKYSVVQIVAHELAHQVKSKKSSKISLKLLDVHKNFFGKNSKYFIEEMYSDAKQFVIHPVG